MNIYSKSDGSDLEIDKKETYRYLGYHFGGNIPPDPEIEKLVEELTSGIKTSSTPRCAFEIYDLILDNDCCFLYASDIICNSEVQKFKISDSITPLLQISSHKLSAHLADCHKAILFGATLGPGVDILIRRYSGRSTIKPAILQAAGASAIEAFADEATEYMKKSLFSGDLPVFKMRFSPGYGDFSLEHQNDFFRLLNLERTLGLSLNSALLMSPSKSITAIIGVSA